MKTPLEKEFDRLQKKEKAFLMKSEEKKASVLNQMLEQKIPLKLQDTLNAAFAKAFCLILEKGTGFIEKTYKREEAQRQFKLYSYALDLKEDRKGFRQLSRQANLAGQKNLLLSGIEGVGLGVLGIGLPDIPLFTGMLLKSIYEIALYYGYDYESTEEKYFILLLIKTALSYGTDIDSYDHKVNMFIKSRQLPNGYSKDDQIVDTAAALSSELLYMKFLQGIPLIGAIGGLYDVKYLQKAQKYAVLKYTRRFLWDRKKKEHLF